MSYLIFSIFSFLFVFFYFYFDNHKKNKLFKLFFISLLLLLTLFPFFFLGPLSAIGGYDELDGQIAWYWSLLNNEEGKNFLHGYAGGTSIKNGLISGNEFFSLYRFLCSFLPEWISGTLFKFFGLILLYSGLYQSSRKIFSLNRITSTYIALFGTLISYLPYTSALGGYGWSLGILSWIPLIFIFEKDIPKLYFKACLIGILAALSSEFLLLAPLAAYFYLLVVVLFSLLKRFSFNINQIIATFIAIGIFALNSASGIFEVINIWDFSARFVNKQYLFEGSSLGVFYDKALSIYSMFKRPPHFLIFFLFVFVFLSILRDKQQLKIFITLAFLSILIPYFLTTFSIIMDISFLKSFRWDQFAYTSIAGAPFLFMAFIKKLGKSSLKRYFLFSLALASVIAVSLNSSGALLDLDLRGGFAVKERYSTLPSILKKDQFYRVITTNYEPPPSTPIFYGIQTLDGMRISSGIRRAFFFKILNNSEELHATRHTITSDIYNINLDLLKMSNVAYILSNKKFQKIAGMHLLTKIEGLTIRELNESFFTRLPKELFNISLARDLYVYSIDDYWPRVFSGEILNSSLSFKTKEFFKEIVDQNSHVTVFSKEDILEFGIKEKIYTKAEIISYAETKNGMEINLNKGGLVTINQEYNPFWVASCASHEELPIFPSNGIMMSIDVPQACKKVELISIL